MDDWGEPFTEGIVEFPVDQLIADLKAVGYEIVKRGTVPSWMERVSSMPNALLYRMKKQSGASLPNVAPRSGATKP